MPLTDTEANEFTGVLIQAFNALDTNMVSGQSFTKNFDEDTYLVPNNLSPRSISRTYKSGVTGSTLVVRLTRLSDKVVLELGTNPEGD